MARTMKEKLRKLPKVDAILLKPEVEAWIKTYGRDLVSATVRGSIDSLRQDILSGKEIENLEIETELRTKKSLEKSRMMNFRRIINATGIVLHTNMGRAVLSEKAVQAVSQSIRYYNNLELNLETGKRGSRYAHVVELIKEITGCEDALVVNNNAAAVLLVLDTLAKGGETLLSRGEMVEIGGSFRVPEVMKLGGTRLVEVGTTNKTHLFDYERAINDNTKVILKVHTSNYRITGFAKSVERTELMQLATEHNLVAYEDLGSGFLADLQDEGITDEPRVQDVVASGMDVISFSGDKLLGGPQAGIIIGKKCYIEKMKMNQLNRALRIDKMTIAALEATLREYLDMERVKRDNPTLNKLTETSEILKNRAEMLCAKLEEALGPHFTVQKDTSQAGGGSLPGVMLPTWVVRLSLPGMDEESLTIRLRKQRPAVMARKNKNELVLDVRTVGDDELDELVLAIQSASRKETGEEK
ncbi:L-seryl-tRNA(Sec) selenium transferase [Clostridia bacterium]|nr:L-seryl-tRNA(Sec) selenium transferase [Clostridia bacterium]